MEYGIWSSFNGNGVWGDPRDTRNPQVLQSALALTALQQTLSPFKSLSNGLQQAIQLSNKLTANPNQFETDTSNKNDNENNLENEDDDEDDDDDDDEDDVKPAEINDNEDDDESTSTSSNSILPSKNNLSTKIFDPMSYFNFDKDETIAPLLNSWVLSAYTAMLGRLSAATAASEAIETPLVPSDSDSESDRSSYTENSRGNSPIAYKSYPCNSVATLKKHSEGNSASPSPSGRSLAQGNSGKKRTLTLQRVRYRYEREEYRCTLCSYACTIEKAFQRHLRAHANGNVLETGVSCAVCGVDKSSEVDLSRHMRRHRDDRYFCCDICVFRTVQLKKLIQHRRMHTGEKPHLCPHCAYRSARRDNLRSHVRRVHKKENLYCDTFSPRGMLIEQLISSNNISNVNDDSMTTTTTTTTTSATTTIQTPASSPSSSCNVDNLN